MRMDLQFCLCEQDDDYLDFARIELEVVMNRIL